MKKDKKLMRAVVYHFGRVEPGEVASLEQAEEGARKLSRVIIGKGCFNRGVTFAGLSAGAFVHDVSSSENPVELPPEIIAASVPVTLKLANCGDRPEYPSAVVVMEVLR